MLSPEKASGDSFADAIRLTDLQGQPATEGSERKD
jgi:hypothetical protein